jgi:uncharacterized protein (DUF1697 family)
MSRYVALLRGINVGGNNLIKMAALKACFEKHGFSDVVTYIQSGNVVFSAREAKSEALAPKIERVLGATFGYAASIVLRSRRQMQAVVDRAPDGFGAEPGQYRYNVIFLRPALSAAMAMKSVTTAPGVDQAHAGAGVLYFAHLISKASRSRLSRLVSMPVYQDMTIRNWNTTTALLRMMNETEPQTT